MPAKITTKHKRKAKAKAVNPPSIYAEAVRKEPESIDMGEISTAVSTWANSQNRFWAIQNYNPDELVQKKGLKIYKKVRLDEQVKAAMQTINDAILSSGWEIEEPTLDEGSEEIAEEMTRFIEFNLGKDGSGGEMEGVLEQKLEEIMSARTFGFSVSEPIFKYIDYGEFEGFLGLKTIKTRDPENIEFETDIYGDLVENGILQNGKPLPSDRFIVYVYRKEFDSWYGRSELREVYRPYWIKDQTLRFATIALERYGEPIAVVTTERKLNATEKAEILAMFKNLQNRTALIVPKWVAVKFESVARDVGSSYSAMFQELDSWISRGILLPTKLGLSGESETGNYSQSQTEFDIFLQRILGLRTALAALINDQLIKPFLIDLNYEVQSGKYPRFKFRQITERDKQRIFASFIDAISKRAVTTVPDDQNRLRRLINFDPLTDEEVEELKEQDEAKKELEQTMREAQVMGAQAKAENPPQDNPDDEEQEKSLAKKKTAKRTDFEYRNYEHDFSSTQVDLPDEFRKKLSAWINDNIPESDFSPDEKQGDDFHITVKYGLHDNDPTPLAGLLHNWKAVGATLKEIDVFELPDYDVLVVKVQSEGLRKMNRTISDNFPHTDTHPYYQPHLTLAYLKSGKGEKWRGSIEFSGQSFEFDTVWFSSQNDKWTPISLTGPLVAVANKFQRRELSQYEKRVNFEKIDNDLNELASGVNVDIRELLRKSEERTIEQIKALIDRGLRPSDIKALQIDVGPEVTVRFNQFLVDTYKQGADEAKSELPPSKQRDIVGLRFFQGLDPSQALDYFRNTAEFSMKGIIDETLTQKVKRSLLQFLKGGKTMLEEISQIRKIFEPFVGDPTKIGPSGQIGIGFPPGDMAPENALMAYRLENIIRTPMIDALNEGRKAIGDAAGSYLVAYQYSAILDSRTTETCQYLDGLIVRKDDPRLAAITPPSHYQCRSLLIFITIDDLPVEFSTDAKLDAAVRKVPEEFR